MNTGELLASDRIFFEITDLVDYLESNSHVTGIQRFQVCLIHAIAKLSPEAVFVTFHDAGRARRRYMRAIDLFPEEGAVSLQILMSAGLFDKDAFPSHKIVRRLLIPYNRRKVVRGFKKVDIYISAIFMKRRYHQILNIDDAHLPLVDDVEVGGIGGEDYLVISGVTIGFVVQHAFAAECKKNGTSVIQVVHDLIPIVRPEFFSATHCEKFEAWCNKLPDYITHYACVSGQTKSDLLQVKPSLEPSTVGIVRLQQNFPGVPRADTAWRYPDDASHEEQINYVLCVGTLEVRKNGAALLKAWRKVHSKLGDKTPNLVFAGKRGWLINEFNEVLKGAHDISGFVSILGAVSDAELIDLYRNCLFTIFPSLYEGWGIPVGESLWFGKPCVTSNVSSMPEVGGDLCLYVNPEDVEDIFEKMIQLIEDEDLRRSMEHRIRSASLRDWDNVAIDFVEFLANVVRSCNMSSLRA